jgi:16S rRNA processing protein RimM
LVPFFIEDIYVKSTHQIGIKLEDIEDEIDAQKYRGLEVYVDKALFQSVKSEEGFVKWLSYQVYDQAEGFIGVLVEVQNFPAQIMLNVLSESKQMHLIPANLDWIVKVDDEAKSIEMQLPDGLLALNL